LELSEENYPEEAFGEDRRNQRPICLNRASSVFCDRPAVTHCNTR
jgi:hypothetical protein